MPRIREIENRAIYVYGILRDVAHERLEMLDTADWCKGNTFLDGMLMAALTMEAYLNHLGPHLFRCWDEIDRLPTRGKLKLILERIRYQPDQGKRPYQTLGAMIRFRDRIAHGRTETLVDHVRDTPRSNAGPHEDTLTEWESLITEKNMRVFIEDMDLMIRDLWDHSGITDGMLAPGIVGQSGYHGEPT